MSKYVNYEVNVGSGRGNGTVIVPDNATDEEIRLAILDDLYYVHYEVVDAKRLDIEREI